MLFPEDSRSMTPVNNHITAINNNTTNRRIVNQRSTNVQLRQGFFLISDKNILIPGRNPASIHDIPIKRVQMLFISAHKVFDERRLSKGYLLGVLSIAKQICQRQFDNLKSSGPPAISLHWHTKPVTLKNRFTVKQKLLLRPKLPQPTTRAPKTKDRMSKDPELLFNANALYRYDFHPTPFILC